MHNIYNARQFMEERIIPRLPELLKRSTILLVR